MRLGSDVLFFLRDLLSHFLSCVLVRSYQRGAAKVGLIGEGRLLVGVDKGLQGMCVNERRKITVPPHLAYGSTGAGERFLLASS